MSKFLIEVPHEPETVACAKVVHVFLTTGSHFLTHAEWGCMDGDHRALIVVEVEDKNQARGIVPPAFRSQARIVGLNQFSLEQIDGILKRHSASES